MFDSVPKHSTLFMTQSVSVVAKVLSLKALEVPAYSSIIIIIIIIICIWCCKSSMDARIMKDCTQVVLVIRMLCYDLVTSPPPLPSHQGTHAPGSPICREECFSRGSGVGLVPNLVWIRLSFINMVELLNWTLGILNY